MNHFRLIEFEQIELENNRRLPHFPVYSIEMNSFDFI